MPRFTILPIDGAGSSARIIATCPSQVFHIVGRLGSEEADVLRDGSYSFTARLDGNGVWCIFQRGGSQLCRATVRAAVRKAPLSLVYDRDRSLV